MSRRIEIVEVLSCAHHTDCGRTKEVRTILSEPSEKMVERAGFILHCDEEGERPAAAYRQLAREVLDAALFGSSPVLAVEREEG